ncbi:Scr1 family TA system antitoxin-like transcriptional regulator [Nonomuraea sp. NPDC050790]|uniref:Scr1 family TA system antitoxin-like transcriptional regulator n=1 Tax=Nonomuraea sp. NPDC050790 TaxID=3364371 RepID=UPI00379DC262
MHARQVLAAQLREIRLEAGLSGTALAEAAGWHGVSKISKIENAIRPPSADDIRTWCRVCGVSPERTAELLASQRAAAGMWTDSKRINRAGLRAAQKSIRPAFERSTLVRVYQPRMIPGLLQTPAYAEAVLRAVHKRHKIHTDDIGDAVSERISRQSVLHKAGHRFAFLVEEAALRFQLFAPEVLQDQLIALDRAMAIPSVSLGVVPLDAARAASPHAAPVEGFTMFDGEMVSIELVSGHLKLTQPWEVALYAERFSAFSAIAAFGVGARQLIQRAVRSMAQ